MPGPEYEVPAKYGLPLIQAIEEDVRQNQERAKNELALGQREQYKGTVEHIDVRRRELAKIRSQYESLTSEQKVSDTVRISTWFDDKEAP